MCGRKIGCGFLLMARLASDISHETIPRFSGGTQRRCGRNLWTRNGGGMLLQTHGPEANRNHETQGLNGEFRVRGIRPPGYSKIGSRRTTNCSGWRTPRDSSMILRWVDGFS